MTATNRLEIYQALMENYEFVRGSEESVIRNALIKENWAVSSPQQKQVERRGFLDIGKNRRSVINLVYYEKMIHVYDMILEILGKVETMVIERNKQERTLELPLLRIAGLFLVEQNFIDEYIVPFHHLPPAYINSICEEINDEYPNLELIKFRDQYQKMYDLWPEKKII